VFALPNTTPNAGTAPQGVTFTPTDTLNYNTVSGTVNVTVNKATPTITTQPAASAITYGQTLASSTLSGGVGSVAGAFAFTTTNTAPSTGTALQGVTFTPTDTVNYHTVNSRVSVTVNKATPTITTQPAATAITYGQTLASSSLSGGVGSGAGAFTFTVPSTSPSTGTALQGVTFTPTDTVNYNTVSCTVSVTVGKATPTVTSVTATGITYGAALSSSTLSGVKSTPGALAFTVPATLPTAGTDNHAWTFTPTDAVNYTTAIGTVNVTVNKATPTITTQPAASAITYGQTLASSTLIGGMGSVAGAFAFTTPITAPSVGTTSQEYTYTPTDSINYKTVIGAVNVVVNKATPMVMTQPVASAITYGKTLALSTLSGGMGSVPGAFTFTTPSTMPSAGNTLQGYTFTPTDLTNYNTVMGMVSLTVNPLSFRVGEQIQFDFTKFGISGTMQLVGALPTGLTFNAKTGILSGKITGKAGSYSLTLQFFNGKTVTRSLSLPLVIGAYPSGLAGTFQGLLDVNSSGLPAGMLSIIVTPPGVWTASLDLAGSSKVLSAKGIFSLDPTHDAVDLTIPFSAAMTVHLHLDPNSALVNGNYPQGSIRGFRMASGSELPSGNQLFTLAIDQGPQDEITIPAGMGWATGTLSNKGTIALTGQLGDGKAIKVTTQLSATGQAIVWLKPYKNPNSFVGGIVSLRDRSLVKNGPDEPLTAGLSWYRVADTKELSYPNGFGPLQVDAGIAPYTVPASAAGLTTSLGIPKMTFPRLLIDGGGLPNTIAASLPTSLSLDSTFKLKAVPTLLPWSGTVNKANGGFSGTLTLPTSASDVLAGTATVSGVLLEDSYYSPHVGSGLVKIPLKSPKGSFRTAAIVISSEAP
jgi:hypothetical protein